VLGLGIGPLYLAPLSELYGRRPVYIFSFSIFAILNVGCALAPSIGALTALRLLSGMAGSAGPSLGGASIGDLFIKEERGMAQALYGLGPTFGPVLGGILGAFILEGTGTWRWLMWITAIAPAATAILCIIFLRETYAPVLLRKKARRLQKSDEKTSYRTAYDDVHVKNLLLRSITRPLRLIVTSPVCAAVAVYIAM
jgi:multidrug resistance protein